MVSVQQGMLLVCAVCVYACVCYVCVCQENNAGA